MDTSITEAPEANDGQGPDRPEDPRDKQIADLTNEVEQLRVQLAGCSVAALGGTSPPQVAKRGDYGWSPSYQDVLHLRLKLNAALDVIKKADMCLKVEGAISDVAGAAVALEDVLPDDVRDTAELLIERLEEMSTIAARDLGNAKTGLEVAMTHGLFTRPSSALVVHKLTEPGAKTKVACGSMSELNAGELTPNWVDTTCKVCLFNRPPISQVSVDEPTAPPT